MFWFMFFLGILTTVLIIIGWRLLGSHDEAETQEETPATPPVVRYLTIYSRDTNQCVVENQPYTTETMDEDGNITWVTLPSGEIKLEPRDGSWVIIRREGDIVEMSN